jgi:hypothetical protein
MERHESIEELVKHAPVISEAYDLVSANFRSHVERLIQYHHASGMSLLYIEP